MLKVEAVRTTPDGITVQIEVSPNSGQFQITGYNQWRQTLEVKIKAPPTKGKANKEIIKEFSKLTGHHTKILSGHKSRQNTLKISGIGEKTFFDILKKIEIDL